MQRSALRLAALLTLLSGAAPAWAQVPRPSLVVPAPAPQAAPAQAPRPRGPTTIEAEKLEGIAEMEVSARGRVEFQREDLSIYAEYLRYNQEFGRVEADGGVRLERLGDRIFGSRLRFDTTNDSGVFEEPKFILRREQSAHGAAERMETTGRDHIRLTRGWFTSCQPGQEDWRFDAGEIELDYETNTGKLKDGGKLRHQQVSLAKRANAMAALEVARTARTILGGNGISLEHPIIRHMVNLETVITYEGTHEVHTLVLGQDLTGIAAFA